MTRTSRSYGSAHPSPRSSESTSQLRRVGNRLTGLCPFHDERSPSFSVNAEQGFFHCFGCAENGDVISFVQKIDHLDFRDAVERLAARVGVQLRYEQGSAAPRQEHNQRARLVAANAAAAQDSTPSS